MWNSGCQVRTHNLHKPVRKTFPRTPYTVTNIVDECEMDLACFSSLSKYSSKYIHGVAGGMCETSESVPYVKLYPYNPKHLYPKLHVTEIMAIEMCGLLGFRRTVRRA